MQIKRSRPSPKTRQGLELEAGIIPRIRLDQTSRNRLRARGPFSRPDFADRGAGGLLFEIGAPADVRCYWEVANPGIPTDVFSGRGFWGTETSWKDGSELGLRTENAFLRIQSLERTHQRREIYLLCEYCRY